MIINITYKTTVEEVQRKVSTAYPFLKMEFSVLKNEDDSRMFRRHFCSSEMRLLELAKKPEPGWVVMHPWHTIRYIEEAFMNRFGVLAQFFRKEQDHWIEILGTEGFSLEAQNEIGRDSQEKTHEVFRTERELLF
jgi:hypothetical protein